MRLSAFCRQAHFAFYRRFFKNFALFLAKQKVACIIPRKGEVLPPFGRKEVNTMTPNRREFEKQCAFQKFCKSVCTMKRATPMRKFVGAEFGRLLFPTLPCMRNGSFIPSISIFKTKKQSRLIKWQEKK